MALPNLQNLQPNLADLLKDEGYEQLRAFLDEHDLDPSDEVAILTAIRERGWEPVITGSARDWEIEIYEPGPSGPIQSHVLQDEDRQRALLRALDMTLWWSTTTAARESFDRNTKTMLGMSAEEFVRKLEAGELDRDDPHVRFLTMLRPLGT